MIALGLAVLALLALGSRPRGRRLDGARAPPPSPPPERTPSAPTRCSSSTTRRRSWRRCSPRPRPCTRRRSGSTSRRHWCFQPGSQPPDFSGLDEVVALAQRYDLSVVADLLTIPTWMADCATPTSTPSRCATDDLSGYASVISQIAARADPAIRDWEVWNEPDTTQFFDGTPQQYAFMLRTAHDAIKSVDPADNVLLGGVSASRRRAGWRRCSPPRAPTRSTPLTSPTSTSAGTCGSLPPTWPASGSSSPPRASTGRSGSPSTATRQTPSISTTPATPAARPRRRRSWRRRCRR